MFLILYDKRNDWNEQVMGEHYKNKTIQTKRRTLKEVNVEMSELRSGLSKTLKNFTLEKVASESEESNLTDPGTRTN